MGVASLPVKNQYEMHLRQLQQHLMKTSPEWMQTLRQQQLNEFFLNGFPTRRLEDWKYTDVSAIEKIHFTLPDALATASGNYFAAHKNITDTIKLVFVDGYFSKEASIIPDLPKGVLLCALDEALHLYPDKLKPYFAEGVDKHFGLLNTALMTDGLFLSIDDHVELTQPIHLLFLNTHLATDKMMNLRNLILLGANSRVTLIEEHSGAATRYFKNTIMQLYLESGAKANYHKLQSEGIDVFHIARTVVQLQHDSQFNAYSFALGGHLTRDDLDINFLEPNASCALYGLYMGDGQQHIDQHTRINHRVENCNSHEFYKGILGGKASGVFNGKVIVFPQAQQTAAHQKNQNLLLSKTAEVNAKPELEIYADNVKCTHGATVGQIDKQALFYLRSRGIPEQAATSLLIQAFAGDIVNQIEQPLIADYIKEVIDERVNKLLSA